MDGTLESLVRDYILLVILLVLILLFALYVKLFPTPLSGRESFRASYKDADQ